ncbi:ORF106 [Staphylococcus phage 37]|uniref:ORF106 n=1 Tax=Staphylococcus phage 37 TaxID=2936813 RepID=Q4ZCE3_9CAUD|nr:ORF106 [Staphylococcus phage 37]
MLYTLNLVQAFTQRVQGEVVLESYHGLTKVMMVNGILPTDNKHNHSGTLL